MSEDDEKEKSATSTADDFFSIADTSKSGYSGSIGCSAIRSWAGKYELN